MHLQDVCRSLLAPPSPDGALQVVVSSSQLLHTVPLMESVISGGPDEAAGFDRRRGKYKQVFLKDN